MFKTIADPVDCEVHSIIHFLNASNEQAKPVEIHRQLVDIYGENVMSDEIDYKTSYICACVNTFTRFRQFRRVGAIGIVSAVPFRMPPGAPSTRPRYATEPRHKPVGPIAAY
ncbi:hypothetical protein TNCV_224291 [Trichonephila clavipes]|nr:hypothetical protein TNCV_224291 [Trichonephila clavipes]